MAFGYRVNLGPVQTILENIAGLTDDLKEPLELAGLEAQRIIAEKFEKQGPNWAPLSDYTIEMRRNSNKGTIKILQDEGTLRNSITDAKHSNGGVYTLTDTTLTIGSNLVYAAIQNFGWPAGSKHPPPTIPARPYIPTPEEMIERIHAKMLRWAQDKVDG